MADKLRRAANSARNDATKVVGSIKTEIVKAASGGKGQIVKSAIAEKKESPSLSVKAAQKTTKSVNERDTSKTTQIKESIESTREKTDAKGFSPVVYVQYMGEEKKIDDLIFSAKAAFSVEHPGTEVVDLHLYVKPEDRAAYYVINEKILGRIDF